MLFILMFSVLLVAIALNLALITAAYILVCSIESVVGRREIAIIEINTIMIIIVIANIVNLCGPY